MFNATKLKTKSTDKLFLVTVLLPVLLSVLYFGVFASDVYVSESRFVVRSPEKPAASGLGTILESAGFGTAGDEVYAAQSYAASRDALRAINARDAYETAYTRPGIFVFDRFNPFGIGGSFEDLYKYFSDKLSLVNDSTTSITTLTVRAYTAQDAQRFNEQLLRLSESTVNRLNERGRKDLVLYAEREVDAAKSQSQAASLALATYRNQSGVIDPEKQAEVQMQMVSKLQDAMIAAKSELAQLQRFTPENPRIPVVRSQLATVQGEIDRELGRVVGNRRSLAAGAVRYQRLFLETQFADKQLTAALASLENARNESRRQQAYVERIVEPNLPDAPIEPRRLRAIFATLALGLIAYGILRMLLAGVRENMVNDELAPVTGRLLHQSGWMVSRRVIGALLLRELLTRYGRNNIGFLWLFVEPMLFTLLITALWSMLRTVNGSNIPIVAFAITGYSSLLLWRNMPGRCTGALKANATLLYHRQVTIMDVYAARILLEWVATTTAFVVIAIALHSVDLVALPENILQVLGGWLLLGWFGVGLGLTIGGLSEKFDIVGKLWPPFTYLLMPLSGVAYIVDALPPKFQEIVLWLPMLNALEYLREGWFGSLFRAHYDIPYVMICNLCLTFVGFALVRQIGTDPSEE